MYIHVHHSMNVFVPCFMCVLPHVFMYYTLIRVCVCVCVCVCVRVCARDEKGGESSGRFAAKELELLAEI
jgi:hypothetical protein